MSLSALPDFGCSSFAQTHEQEGEPFLVVQCKYEKNLFRINRPRPGTYVQDPGLSRVEKLQQKQPT